MKKSIAIGFVLCSFYCVAQQDNSKSPASFFSKETPKVLVVGTFHFDYPNLDAMKTEDNNKIDVLQEPKKSEVTELVSYIKKFNATKIAIEARPNWKAGEKLKRYKKGEFRQERDERFQLGMRIANELKLDTLYSIDVESMDADLAQRDSVYITKLFKDFDFQHEDPYVKMFLDWFAHDEKLPKSMSLLTYFKRINSREAHRLNYGAYLVGDFKLDDTRGADILSVWWYNRNLRIFRKIQQMKANPNDRILVIIGNGHAAILRNLLESSPEYQYVEFEGLK